jgi:hypothetical protein
VVGSALCLVVSRATLSGAATDETAGPADRTLDVRVTFEGKPVEGAQVVAIEVENQIRAVTDRDGKCQVRLDADRKLASIIALDARLGFGGRSFFSRTVPTRPGTVVEIALAPAKPHTIRVIDHQGNAVRLASIAVSGIPIGNDWFPSAALEAAHLHTDSRGEARVAWIPRDVKVVGVESTDDRWRLDYVRTEATITMVRASRLYPVDGRLSMPEGASPEGVWIMGTGMGHRPMARVRKNGTFTLYVEEGHAYSLAVVDRKWASDVWSGVLLTSENAPPKELKLVAYPAVPLAVLVTRGPKHEPVAGALIIVRSENRRGDEGPLRTLSTDQHGQAQFAVGRGEYGVSMATDNWREGKSITVSSDEPVSVDFYREWADKRTIWGWLIAERRPHRSGPATVVLAWSPAIRQIIAEVAVSPEGAFSFRSDTSGFFLFAIDPKNLLSGARAVAATDTNANVELTPMGSVRGVIVDAAGKGLAGQGIEAVFAGPDLGAWPIVLQSAMSDEQGHFQLDSLPAGILLRIGAGTPADARGAALANRPDNFRVHTSRVMALEPGEVRENVKLVRRGNGSKD